MNESLRSNWKRLLISGLISALIAGVCFGLFLYGSRIISGSVISFILLGFVAPALITPNSSSGAMLMTVIVYWFLIGTVISYLSRKTKKTIMLWVVVYAISFAIALALFADMMN